MILDAKILDANRRWAGCCRFASYQRVVEEVLSQTWVSATEWGECAPIGSFLGAKWRSFSLVFNSATPRGEALSVHDLGKWRLVGPPHPRLSEPLQARPFHDLGGARDDR